MIAIAQETEILKACRTLFGGDIWLDRNFLLYLQPSGAKAAFRKRVKETHPDRFFDQPQAQKQQARLFQDVRHAYDLVDGFLKHREKGLWPAHEAVSSSVPQPAPASPFGASSGPWQERMAVLPRTYELGLYLYSRGVIPYKALIEALVWQRRQRPSIGETARRWGWLSEGHIRSIVSHRSAGNRFGEKAVELGLLTPFQVRTLLFYQRRQQRRIGQYFIEQGYLSHTQLEQLAAELEEHNRQVLTSRWRTAASG